ncbi:MAG: ATP-binding protein, partial [Candidatus Latescibacteria bacterium]|nr:ATP-binding protein [Candidatus Latescibacterota bacterium]
KFTEDGEIAVRAKTLHDQLVISVSDTGIGMPKEALDTIFDEFQQVEGSEQKQKGTGLGLAITKKYTELLRGTISVESEVGKGTTFTVQVPIRYETP